MAVRNVPPTGAYSGTNTSRKPRSFAALYEQARQHSGNDNGGYTPSDDGEQPADQDRRAYAGTRSAPQPAGSEDNRKYIEGLHARVDTLRGEILVRVIQAGNPERRDDTGRITGDISRLSTRLNTLRQKLRQEEERLSGKLVDVEI